MTKPHAVIKKLHKNCVDNTDVNFSAEEAKLLLASIRYLEHKLEAATTEHQSREDYHAREKEEIMSYINKGY